MRQAYELSVLTGTQVLLLVVSETGLVYTFTTPKLQPLVTKAEGKNLIQVSPYHYSDTPLDLAEMYSQACLNAPEPASGNENGVDAEPEDSPEDVGHTQIQAPQAPMPRGGGGGMPQYMSPEQQQQMAYQQYMQQQQQGIGGQYPMPPQGTMSQ